ncbi:hypothetical protein pEaSNUABM37_00033 [Erwinia phage pEa_SNUABM_37]|nr:hypothetical protein pEaSNUABM37_00033 [Erwinia phage pEa_SNUABM_37]QXO10503.1 hypothetical protein pEaSNUABM48_00033 [Erwinia phage pEa_SNUABM_48]
MSQVLAQREIVLIPNTDIVKYEISNSELNELTLKQHYCELGSPIKPADEDYIPARFTPPEVTRRIQRYTTQNMAEVVGLIISSRVDVAGNLVGVTQILDCHPKAAALAKKLLQPKCGVLVQPRIGYAYGMFNRRETKVFGFDVRFK